MASGCGASLTSRETEQAIAASDERAKELNDWTSAEWARVREDLRAGHELPANRVYDLAEIRWIAQGTRVWIPLGSFSPITLDEASKRLQWCESAVAAYKRHEPLPVYPAEWSVYFEDEAKPTDEPGS